MRCRDHLSSPCPSLIRHSSVLLVPTDPPTPTTWYKCLSVRSPSYNHCILFLFQIKDLVSAWLIGNVNSTWFAFHPPLRDRAEQRAVTQARAGACQSEDQAVGRKHQNKTGCKNLPIIQWSINLNDICMKGVIILYDKIHTHCLYSMCKAYKLHKLYMTLHVSQQERLVKLIFIYIKMSHMIILITYLLVTMI